MSAKKDKKQTEKNRQQKNIRVLESTSNKLEKLAKTHYGSTQKQGQVVDYLVDMYGDDTMLKLIKEIHESTVKKSKSPLPVGTHTRSETSSKSKRDNAEVAELEELAADEGIIDADEHDLSVISGVRGVDRASIILAALTGEDKSEWTQSEVADYVMRTVGYSRNNALAVAKEVCMQMHQHPLAGMDEWVSDRVKQDIDKGYNDARKGGEGLSEWQYNDRYGGSFADYVGIHYDTDLDTYYLDDAADDSEPKKVRSFIRPVITSSESSKNDVIRATNGLVAMCDKLGDDFKSDTVDFLQGAGAPQWVVEELN